MKTDSPQAVRFCAFAITALLAGAAGAGAQCEERKLFDPGGSPYDEFGYSVAASGDLAAVAAPSFWNGPSGPGSGWGQVFLYRHGAGGWTREQVLRSTSYQESYGCAVAAGGEVLVVGARYGSGLVSTSGAVYVYRHVQGRWSLEQKIFASDGQAYDSFGFAVAVSGDLIAVGCPQNDDNARDSGSVYFFHREGGSWVQRGNWHAFDPAADDWFGFSVALAGNLAVSGAPGKSSSRGAAYAVSWSAGPYWISHGKLTAPDGASYDCFGESVAADTYVAVGAPDHDAQGTNSGALYLYKLRFAPPFNFAFHRKLLPSAGSASDWFGRSVSIDGDVLVAGAPGDAPLGASCGAAYVFREAAGGNWIEERRCRASSGAAGDLYARSVSLSGDFFVAGAYADDDAGRDSGTAWVHRDATWSSYGSGWPGSNATPALSASADPLLGTTIALNLTNSLAAPTTCVLIIGYSAASIPTGLGGQLLVNPFAVASFPIAAAGASLPLALPSLSAFSGMEMFAQALELDPGASAGVSFTPGLRLSFGQY